MEGLFTLAENGMTLEEIFGSELAKNLSIHDDALLERAKKLKEEMLSLLEQLDSAYPG